MQFFPDLEYKLPVPRFLLNMGFATTKTGLVGEVGYLWKRLSDSKVGGDLLSARVAPPNFEYNVEGETYGIDQEHRFQVLYDPAGTWDLSHPWDGTQVLVYTGDSVTECRRAIKSFLKFRNGQPIPVEYVINRLPNDFSEFDYCSMEMLIAPESDSSRSHPPPDTRDPAQP